MNCVIDWGNVAQWVGAIGTIFVVIIAIWGEWLQKSLGLGPKLVLKVHDPMGEYYPLKDAAGKTIYGRWYHLCVSNKRRWAKAINVRIVIVYLAKLAADGSFKRQPLSGPLQLQWRFSGFHTLFSDVGPDDICDLGNIYEGDGFKLTPFIYPANFEGTLTANQKMRVMINALADNAESKPLSLEIFWDGKWEDEEIKMSGHLEIKTIQFNSGENLEKENS